MTPPLLEVRNLRKHFELPRGKTLKAVDGVSFALRPGRTLALVGESGCGKSTTARLVVRLLEPTSGQVIFDERPVTSLDRRELRTFRRRAQLVFQDSHASLNPRMTVGATLEEPLEVHGLAPDAAERSRRVDRLLATVGLGREHRTRLPHELSGGQRQRVGIARALAVEPDLLVLDEPVSALDVSVQAQVLGLLERLQGRLGLAYLFITHDLALVRHVSHEVAVMYMGKIFERAPTGELFSHPRHPYTRSLLEAIPRLRPRRKEGGGGVVLSGEPARTTGPLKGCSFYPRCPHPLKDQECIREEPLLEAKATSHFSACWKEPGEGVERG